MKTVRRNLLFYFLLSCLFYSGFVHSMRSKKQRGLTHRFAALWNQLWNTSGYALIRACVDNDIQLAKKLINKGANVNATNKYGSTSLLWACRNSNTKLAKFLIESGACVNAKDTTGYTPFLWACWMNNEDVAKLLIARGADVNAKNDHQCSSPLGFVCWRENKALAGLMLEEGVDINAKLEDEKVPLELAWEKEKKEFAKFLIECGADITVLEKSDKFRKQFQEERKRYSLLNSEIEKLKNELDSDKDYLLPMREEIEKIDELMRDPRTPLFAKQSALPYLLRYHRIYPKRIPENKLLAYYKEILFNYRFFTDNRFKQVLEFAIKVGAKDKKDRSVLDTALVGRKYYQRAIAKLLEMTNLSNLFQRWLMPSDSTESDNQKKEPNTCRYMLKLAKNMNRKKLGKSLMNIAICSYDLESKTPLPSEIVSNIVSFAKL